MPTADEVVAARTAGWWWLNLDTGAALQAKDPTGPARQVKDGELLLIHVSGSGPGPGLPRLICYGSLEELQDMVRRWLGDDLHIEESLLEGPPASVERPTLGPVVMPDARRVSGYRGPLSSPWAVPLPKTVAEARSLYERAPVGVEGTPTMETFLQHLIGVWVHCAADARFPRPMMQGPGPQAIGGVGLVIEPDGRWAVLFETDGELHTSTGWDSEGTWTVVDTSLMNGPGNFQVDLRSDGGRSGVGLHPIRFASSLPLMRAGVDDYVKLDRSIPIEPA